MLQGKSLPRWSKEQCFVAVTRLVTLPTKANVLSTSGVNEAGLSVIYVSCKNDSPSQVKRAEKKNKKLRGAAEAAGANGIHITG